MTNELLALFEYYEKEKGIKRDTMIDALETALLSASRKSIGPAREMRIHIDPEKGDIRAYATLIVRDRVANAYEEIDIFTARRLKPAAPSGGKRIDLRRIQGPRRRYREWYGAPLRARGRFC